MDIFAQTVQFRFAADDVFPVVALPDGVDRSVLPRPFGHPDLKTADDGTDGLGCSTGLLRRLWGRKIFRPYGEE